MPADFPIAKRAACACGNLELVKEMLLRGAYLFKNASFREGYDNMFSGARGSPMVGQPGIFQAVEGQVPIGGQVVARMCSFEFIIKRRVRCSTSTCFDI